MDQPARLDWVHLAHRQTERLCQQVAEVLAAEGIVVEWQVLQMPLVEISSSLIRQYCHDCRSIRYLVPDAVRNYILDKQLYGADI